jgi:hypothetical protein
MSKANKFDYRVRIQVSAESHDGILLDCLKNERHPSYSHKEMLLWALRAYWLPIAYQIRQVSGEPCQTEAQLRQMAIHSIHQLKQQIAYLQTLFELPPDALERTPAIAPSFVQESVTGLALPHLPEKIGEVWFESEDLFES